MIRALDSQIELRKDNSQKHDTQQLLSQDVEIKTEGSTQTEVLNIKTEAKNEAKAPKMLGDQNKKNALTEKANYTILYWAGFYGFLIGAIIVICVNPKLISSFF